MIYRGIICYIDVWGDYLELLSLISDISGIISFIISIVLLLLNNKLKNQIGIYKRNQKDIVKVLKSYRESIYQDGLYAMNIRSGIRTELNVLLMDYKTLLSIKEKSKIKETINILMNDKLVDKELELLCSNLDFVIARFIKKESLI